MSLSPALKKLREMQDLTAAEAEQAFAVIFAGAADEDEIGEFLLLLHEKTETSGEIMGAVTSMRARMAAIEAPPHAIDIVGTGGDGRNTLNISTAAAFVVAGCGVPVAKHGNRAATSKSGSSDVLAALGINLEPPMPVLEECLAEANICFLFAPRHHPSMKHVAPVRRKLGVRTIFNLLGPLTNPANVKRHLIGVYSKRWLEPIAEALQKLGSQSAWVTHGRDGMDELTTSTESDAVVLHRGKLFPYILSPQEFGIARPGGGTLMGGDAEHNAERLRNLLAGEQSPYRDIVLLNAAAALIAADRAEMVDEGMRLAAESIDSGAAEYSLNRLVEMTHG